MQDTQQLDEQTTDVGMLPPSVPKVMYLTSGISTWVVQSKGMGMTDVRSTRYLPQPDAQINISDKGVDHMPEAATMTKCNMATALQPFAITVGAVPRYLPDEQINDVGIVINKAI